MRLPPWIETLGADESEFGRRVAQNGSLGTDHGHGSCFFVMGDGISGGLVIAQWRGLAVGSSTRATWR